MLNTYRTLRYSIDIQPVSNGRCEMIYATRLTTTTTKSNLANISKPEISSDIPLYEYVYQLWCPVAEVPVPLFSEA